MSDLDDLCDKVNRNRVKYDRPKNHTSTGSGIKHQFRTGISKNGMSTGVIYTLGKWTGDEGRMSVHMYIQNFDKNGNMIGD